jgi:hypothetical protein
MTVMKYYVVVPAEEGVEVVHGRSVAELCARLEVRRPDLMYEDRDLTLDVKVVATDESSSTLTRRKDGKWFNWTRTQPIERARIEEWMPPHVRDAALDERMRAANGGI